MISSSPHLAQLVRSLTFGFVSSHIPTPSRPWLEVIARGLRSLTNLKELNLNKRGSGTQFVTPSFAWILNNTSFQLKAFRNRMFDLEPTIPFLTLQPSITTWDNLGANPCLRDPALLPLLSDATIPSWLLPIYHSRNITRLQTSIYYEDPAEEYHTVNNLVAYGRTLTMLVLERGVIDRCSKLGDFVALIGGNLPLLEIFSPGQGGHGFFAIRHRRFILPVSSTHYAVHRTSSLRINRFTIYERSDLGRRFANGLLFSTTLIYPHKSRISLSISR